MYMEEGMEHDIVDGLESEGEHDDAYGHSDPKTSRWKLFGNFGGLNSRQKAPE